MKHIFTLGLLAMGIAASAAQAGVQAKFHLPFEAHWGAMTLQAGDYKVTLPENSLGTRQFSVTGDQANGYVQPMVADLVDNSGDSTRSYLKVAKINGEYYVTKYRSALTGKTYNFMVPKHKHSLKMEEDATLEVGVSGN